MKPLSKVLEGMQTGAEPKFPNSATSSTEAPGFTTEDGKLITASQRNLPSPLAQTEKVPEISEQERKWSEDMRVRLLTKWGVSLRKDRDGIAEVSEIISTCFLTLRNYGKQPDQIGQITKVFLMLLADYPTKAIRQAFKEYMRENEEFPTPANIIKILNEDIDLKYYANELKGE